MHAKSNSQRIYERLCEVIPSGVNSPIRACKGIIDPPMVVERGEHDMIYDVDGNSYIDFCCSWGALLHGHAHPTILAAVQKRMALGTSFGITTEIEESLARAIVDRIPSVEKIRFVSSGTEATMSVARLARGFTKRNLIVKFSGNYHGHADFFLVKAGSGVMNLCPSSSSAGIPDQIVQHTVSLTYNDIEESCTFIRANGTDIAAVILEPIAGNMGVVPATQEFIAMLREETKKVGALLIFDEVITGFRVGSKGAQGIYPVKPDLTCFGKIIGGGFPAAAFGGRADIMDYLAPLGPVYQAGTLSGNPVAMEAGVQALALITDNTYTELERKAAIITKPIQAYFEKHNIEACVQECGSMFTIFFGKRAVHNMDDAKALDSDRFKAFFRYMYSHGVYIPPLQQEAWFVSTVHTDANLEKTRDLVLGYLNN